MKIAFKIQITCKLNRCQCKRLIISLKMTVILLFIKKKPTVTFLEHDDDNSRVRFSSLIYHKNRFLCKIKRNIDPHLIYAVNLSPDFNLYGENPDVVHLLGGRSPQINNLQFVTHTILTVPTWLRQYCFSGSVNTILQDC